VREGERRGIGMLSERDEGSQWRKEWKKGTATRETR
jgi:hypothetical protein